MPSNARKCCAHGKIVLPPLSLPDSDNVVTDATKNEIAAFDK